MSRLQLQFGCGKHKLAGTLDTAPGSTGLLLVSGGNELRSGAFSSQSRIAAAIARAGFPVFRFDRRGIGDSQGENRGFLKSEKDIRAALESFRAMAPQVNRVVGFGNCDAASALMLMEGRGFDGLILSNPWTFEEESSDDLPPEAIRSRYLEKLRNPGEIMRLLKGGVDLGKLARGIATSLRPAPEASGLSMDMKKGLDAFGGRVRILLATSDRTAQAFESGWDSSDPRISRCQEASHAYVEPEARRWLLDAILEELRA